MSGEEQERIEDYLELETVVAALQAGHTVHLPQDITPEQARLYRMVILFHSTFPQACEPQPAFAAALEARIEQEFRQMTNRPHLSALDRKGFPKRGHTVSRRSILTGGATVATALAIGAGIEQTLERIRVSMGTPPISVPPVAVAPSPPVQTGPLVPAQVPSTWHVVTTLADLGENAIRFTTDTVVGYVLDISDSVKSTSESPTQATRQIIALSAACTHMGCIVQWHDADHHFHCPCHGGIFTENGMGLAAPGTKSYLLPLPRLETKVEHGNVYVRVPVSR